MIMQIMQKSCDEHLLVHFLQTIKQIHIHKPSPPQR